MSQTTKNISNMSKGGEDLVKDSALMLTIDDSATTDYKTNTVGGKAYESVYVDNMTVSQVMNIQKSNKNQEVTEESEDITGIFLLVAISIGVILMIVLGVLTLIR